jgi:hypothetical protein
VPRTVQRFKFWSRRRFALTADPLPLEPDRCVVPTVTPSGWREPIYAHLTGGRARSSQQQLGIAQDLGPHTQSAGNRGRHNDARAVFYGLTNWECNRRWCSFNAGSHGSALAFAARNRMQCWPGNLPHLRLLFSGGTP